MYAILALYLLVCSFWLTGRAFAVCRLICWLCIRRSCLVLQDIPAQLKNKSTHDVIVAFFTPPVGPLIAAIISTFGMLRQQDFTSSLTTISRNIFLCLFPLRETFSHLFNVRSVLTLIKAGPVAYVLQLLTIPLLSTKFHQCAKRVRILQLA